MSASSKRVLYVDHTAKASGGEIALFNLVNALDKSRITPVFVLASDGPLAEKLRRVGIETHILPLDGSVVDARKDSLGLGSLLHVGKIWRTIGYAVRLSKFARRHNIDLVHTNSLKADIYGGIAGRLARIPVIWHVRDNIDANYLPRSVAFAFRLLARVIPSAVVANSQSTLARLQIPGRSRRKAVVYSGIANLDSAERMHLVHDGLDINTFDPSMTKSIDLEEDNGHSIVAIVGRIAQWKGQDVFLKAAAEVLTLFPKTQFWIIGAPLFGEYEYEKSLHLLAENLGIAQQVSFLGMRNDVPALLSKVAIVIHASVLGEPFGQVIIEGMAAGKPVIASNGGAIPEIVIPGETGLLHEMGDFEGLATAILSLLSDPERANAMGEAGRERVRQCFTIENSARIIEGVYVDMLSERTGRRGPSVPATTGLGIQGES